MKHRVTPEQFIDAWNASSSYEEAANKTGLSVQSVRSKSHLFRSKFSVALKKMPRPRRVDWDAVRAYAKKHTKPAARTRRAAKGKKKAK